MKNVRVVFMGTPEFALEPLKKLIDIANVVLVVTKKDAYVGRKKVLTPSCVKEFAISKNIPVITPENIKKEYQSIIQYQPDLIVTCAYGKIIPKDLIIYPKFGCINIHASLLPKYRGAAPIQWAMLNGEKETGITLMYMDEFMDTGDIIDYVKCPIKDEDDIASLHSKLSTLGTNLLEKNFSDIISRKVNRQKQNNALATMAPMITREMEELDFNNSVLNVYNKIRAFSPWPLSKTIILGEEIKIIKSHYTNEASKVGNLYITKDKLGIGCLDGIIYFDIIKPIGKKEMPIKNYLNGKKELLNGSKR